MTQDNIAAPPPETGAAASVRPAYEAPRLTTVGQIAQLVAGAGFGAATDGQFPTSSPRSPR